MNLIEGSLEHEGALSFVRIGEHRIALGRHIDLPPLAQVVVGIRPEHVTLAPMEGATFSLPFSVELIEPTGADSHVYGRSCEAQVVASLSRRDSLALGEQVILRGRCEQLHVFDKASGLRID